MSLAFAPPLLALDFQDLFGLAIVILFLLQGLKPKKKPSETSTPTSPRAPSQTSDNAPAAEPMARPEGSSTRPDPTQRHPAQRLPGERHPAERDPWRRAPQPQQAPPRKRERLVPQDAEQGPGSLESRRSAARTRTAPLPPPGAMSGSRSDALAARSGAHHEHLVDLGETSLKSNRHPGMSPTEAAAPKQRQFVNTGRALLGSGLTGRDRLRGAFAWSIIFGRPKARTFGQPSRRI